MQNIEIRYIFGNLLQKQVYFKTPINISHLHFGSRDARLLTEQSLHMLFCYCDGSDTKL